MHKKLQYSKIIGIKTGKWKKGLLFENYFILAFYHKAKFIFETYIKVKFVRPVNPESNS
jgi:hypothetical protein